MLRLLHLRYNIEVTCFLCLNSDKTWVFDQSEHAEDPYLCYKCELMFIGDNSLFCHLINLGLLATQFIAPDVILFKTSRSFRYDT